MLPENERGRPAAELDGQATRTRSTDRVADHRGFGWHDWSAWCPCGHIDDADCVRHDHLARESREVDYLDSAVGFFDADGPRVTSLRQHQTLVQLREACS